MLVFTISMQMYSIIMEAMFIARTVQMATMVDAIATRDMISGPMSLQDRSIRRIRALTTIFVRNNTRIDDRISIPRLQSSSPSVITTT